MSGVWGLECIDPDGVWLLTLGDTPCGRDVWLVTPGDAVTLVDDVVVVTHVECDDVTDTDDVKIALDDTVIWNQSTIQ